MSVISVKNLSQRYGNGRLIYDNLSFDVPQGRILGLLGKNGTGKTTTINILMGFLKPQSGECRIFDENINTMRSITRTRIALLIEGHVQYPFMTIGQIERFYSRFYPRWNRDAYYGLMQKLKVSDGQKISSMSCGQRSQVALGLILAQNADLLVLDDFSLGLDPGYRRLFVDYMKDYVKSEGKTVFMTSHIIQDMERLIDDCIILDYGKILTQMPVKKLMGQFNCYRFITDSESDIYADSMILNPSKIKNEIEIYSFANENDVKQHVISMGIT
ncbi:MAG: ABC transporter ATP-binding protein, partial [Muribaculaceae bacterium]|nr:ABC transporter ATP-binding protein [Muribaculaceae bacterium]